MKIKIYNNLSVELKKEWDKLWEKSEVGNFTNSSFWFLAADNTYNYKVKKIVALLDEKNNLIAITALVREKIAGVSVWTVPALEFADSESILIQHTDKKLIEFFINELSKIGFIYLTNYKENTLNYFTKNKYLEKLFADTNILVEFSYGPYGNLTQNKLNKLQNRLNANNINWKVDVDVKDKFKALDEAFEIELHSTKLNRGKSVFDKDLPRRFYKNLVNYAPEKNIISIFYIDNKPIAYSIYFKNKNSIQGSQKANLPEFNYYSPARILIADICLYSSELGNLYYDFGRGVDDFKRSFATSSNNLYSIFISKNLFLRKYLILFFRVRNTAYNRLVKFKKLYKFYKFIVKGGKNG